jgi:membrane fusion protein (multidrug efflux system)
VQSRGKSGRVFELALLALFVGWLSWFFFAEVAVHEVSAKARLEVQSAPHPVAAPLAGRVVETRLAIGRAVSCGDVLLLLDAEADRLAIREHVARADSCRARFEALRKELDAEQEALTVLAGARSSAAEESRAQVEEVEARFRYAQGSLERMTLLKAKRAATDQDVALATAEMEATRAKVASLRGGGLRSERDRSALESEKRARLAKLEREVQELEGTILVEEATICTLERQVADREIRAPVSGRLGDVVVQYQVGSYVQVGAKIGVVIPDGKPHVVAHFPVATLGRLRAGQPARLRLDGFPWVQYGTLPACVRQVGGEPTAGLIQVELELLGDLPPAIPLEHGLPGAVEVQVERVAPVVLVLRSAGKLLTARETSIEAAPNGDALDTAN